MPVTQQHRLLAISTALGPDMLAVRSVSVQEQLSRPFQIEADLSSEDGKVDFDKVIGHNATIRLEIGQKGTRYFNGFVSRLVQVANKGGYAHYHATIVPWLWFLSRTSDCRIFQEKKTSDIIEEVFKAQGFSDYKLNLSQSYVKREYCVQYRETDFNFVSRLMEQEGIYYFFEHENGKHTLVLADSISAHKPAPDYAEIIFHELEKGGTGREAITDWSVEKEVQPVASALNDFDFKKPKTSLRSSTNLTRQHGMAQFEIYDYPGEYLEHSEGDRLADVRLNELQTQYETLHGQTNVRGIVTGSTFKLKNHPRQDQNREYLIIGVSLNADAGEFASGGSQAEGEFFSCSFTAIDKTQQFRPNRLTPKPIVQGPQTAIVVGPKGEEIHTDKYGRVKLQFHWDRYGKADDNSSCWIRVAQVWAGKQWGSIYTPRIGQEVMVEFLEGDPDRPIITGRVYNGEAMPPYELPDEKTKSTIKSNSSKGGQGFNELRFEDKKGSEQIFIHAQHNMDVRVRNTLKETVYGNREIRVGWEKDGESGGNLNSLVRKDVNTHIKGGQFEQVEKDLNQTVQGTVVQDFQKDQSTKVTGTRTLNAKEVVVEAGDAISEKTAKFTLEASQEIGVKGGAINVESSQGISLKCGGNFVTIDSSGVSIKGAMVMINSGGASKPAAAAKSAQLADLETPIEARVADDGKTGQKTQAPPAKPRQRAKVKLTPIKAPPYVPPKPIHTPLPIIEPPPKAKSEKPCGIGELTVQCSHKRKPGASGILQVVADGTTTTKIEKKWGEVLVTITKKSAGEDSIESKIICNQPGASGRKQLSFLETLGSPTGAEWKNKETETFKAHPAAEDDIWPINAQPRVFHVHGRGCDDCSQQITIESYPSQTYSFELSVKFFDEWIKSVNEGWEKWGAKVMGLSPVELKPKITGPKGSFSASWGWKEDKDWRAYFEMAVDIGLNPIFGIGIEISVSMMKIAAAACGIPPLVSDLLAKHLADIIVSAEAGAEAKLTGGPRGRFYATGEERILGEAVFSAEGKLGLKICGRVGSDYIASAAITLGGETKIEGKAKAELERQGLFLEPSVTLKPLTIELVVKTKAFVIFSHDAELGKWSPWEDIDIYKGGRTKLLPR